MTSRESGSCCSRPESGVEPVAGSNPACHVFGTAQREADFVLDACAHRREGGVALVSPVGRFRGHLASLLSPGEQDQEWGYLAFLHTSFKAAQLPLSVFDLKAYCWSRFVGHQPEGLGPLLSRIHRDFPCAPEGLVRFAQNEEEVHFLSRVAQTLGRIRAMEHVEYWKLFREHSALHAPPSVDTALCAQLESQDWGQDYEDYDTFLRHLWQEVRRLTWERPITCDHVHVFPPQHWLACRMRVVRTVLFTQCNDEVWGKFQNPLPYCADGQEIILTRSTFERTHVQMPCSFWPPSGPSLASDEKSLPPSLFATPALTQWPYCPLELSIQEWIWLLDDEQTLYERKYLHLHREHLQPPDYGYRVAQLARENHTLDPLRELVQQPHAPSLGTVQATIASWEALPVNRECNAKHARYSLPLRSHIGPLRVRGTVDRVEDGGEHLVIYGRLAPSTSMREAIFKAMLVRDGLGVCPSRISYIRCDHVCRQHDLVGGKEKINQAIEKLKNTCLERWQKIFSPSPSIPEGKMSPATLRDPSGVAGDALSGTYSEKDLLHPQCD